MVELRRQSSRIKAEPGLKRKFSDALEEAAIATTKPAKAAKTPRKAPAKNSTPAKKVPAAEGEAGEQEVEGQEDKQDAVVILPTKLTDKAPLPVLKKPQPSDLDDSKWQNISESGVFSASLARARQAIIKGAFVERFWVKPTPPKKMKDMTEQEKAAFKESKGPTQSKVGTVTMISEPFTFEVQVLMVKDQTGGHRQGQLPPNTHHLIHGGAPQQYRAPQPAYRPPPPASNAVPQPPMRTVGQVTFNVTTPQPKPLTPSSYGTMVAQPANPPARVNEPAKAQTKPAPSIKQGAPNPQAPDPVIHALAQRASSDPELKAVMRVVATGKATPTQLQYFQRHIDDLTEMVKQRQEQEARAKLVSTPLVATSSQLVPPIPSALQSPSMTQTPPGAPSQKPPRPLQANSASPMVVKSETEADHHSAQICQLARPHPPVQSPASQSNQHPKTSKSEEKPQPVLTTQPTQIPRRPPTPQPTQSLQPTQITQPGQTPQPSQLQQTVQTPQSAQAPSLAGTCEPLQKPQSSPIAVPAQTPQPAQQSQPAQQPQPVQTAQSGQTQQAVQLLQPAQTALTAQNPPVVHRNQPASTPQPRYISQPYQNSYPHAPRPQQINNQQYAQGARYNTPQQSMQPSPYRAPPPNNATKPTQRPPQQTQFYHHNQPPPAPYQRTKTVITQQPLHILLQFPDNPNERFLFPKVSILEFNSTLTEVICSFMAVKKSGEEDGKEYWSPITLVFKGDAPTLSVLGRVVEPLETARRKMEDIFVEKEREEEGFLALRLPSEKKVAVGG